MRWPDFQRSLAVVIGIDDYRNGIPRLTTATNDARHLAALLQREYGYDVHLVIEAASKVRLDALFKEQLAQEVDENDRLLVYFAGHGIALDGEDGPEGFLIPQDASPEDRSTFLAMNDLHHALIGLPCRHLLVLLDCCFAGAFRWSSTRAYRFSLPEVLHQERYDRYLRDPAWQVLTSAAYNQRALDLLVGTRVGTRQAVESEDGQHSPFALALFAALRGAGDLMPKGVGDGVITASELYLYLRDTVEVEAEQDANHRQTPGLWPLRRHGNGEYIFLVPGHQLNLPPAPELTPNNNPYRGLQPYQEEHADLLFGRSELIKRLAAQVTAQPLTIVLGASGTGKSSLVKAGLVPALRNAGPRVTEPTADVGHPTPVSSTNGTTPTSTISPAATDFSATWRILPPMRPGDLPQRVLADLVARELTQAAREDPTTATTEHLVASWLALHPTQHLLLVVDQFEELITLCRDEQERMHFISTLARLAAHPAQCVHIVITLRTDFEPQFGESPLAVNWAAGRFVVPPLNQAELREVIEQPAARRVLFFDPPELVDKLIDEVIQTPGALPLLSFTLSELYLKYLSRQTTAQREGLTIERSLTAEDYQALGGVIGSLRTRADEVYATLDPAQQATMQRIMLRMVAVEGGELARRRVLAAELEFADPAENERVLAVVDRLVEARLLVRGSADLDDDEIPDTYVEPAHDALVRAWDKLLIWKQHAEEYLPLQRRLARAAQEWQRAPTDDQPGLLWNNDPGLLQVLPDLMKQSGAFGFLLDTVRSLWPSAEIELAPAWLNRLETLFVETSLHQRTRIRRRAVLITVAVIVSLVVLTTVAFIQRNNARRQAEVSMSTALSSNAQQSIQNKDYDLAIALALQANQIEDPPAVAVNTLAAAAWVPGTQAYYAEHQADVTGVAISPDGKTLLSASLDGSAVLWDVATQTVTYRLDASQIMSVTSAAYSPQGDLALLGQVDGAIAEWEVQSGAIRRHLTGLSTAVTALTFSADGRHILAGDQRGELALWEVEQEEPILRLPGQQDLIKAVAISADGQRALSGGRDKLMFLWDLETGEQLQRFEGHTRDVVLVAFGPFPNNVLSGSRDRNVVIWNINTGKPVQGFPLREHTQEIGTIAVAPNFSTALSGAWDGSMILWDKPPLGGLIRTFVGHRAPVISLAYSKDGRQVISGSKDGVVRLWDIGGPAQLQRITVEPALVERHRIDPVHNLAIDEAHQRAFSGAAGALILWDLETGQEIHRFAAPTDNLSSMAFSADGQRALSGADGDLTLWDMQTYTAVQTLAGHTARLLNIAFAPDGASAWSASIDGLVIGWNLTTGQPLWQQQLPLNDLWSIAFNTDGSQALTGAEDRSVVLWDLQTGQELRHFAGHHDAVYWVTLSTDGQRALSGSADRQVILWDVTTGLPIRTFQGHTLPVHAVAFSPDGHTILSGGEDRIVHLWDVATGAEIFRFEGHSSTIQNILYLQNQPQILSRAEDGSLILWQFPRAADGLEHLDLAYLEQWTYTNRYVRELTCDERTLYKVSPLCATH